MTQTAAGPGRRHERPGRPGRGRPLRRRSARRSGATLGRSTSRWSASAPTRSATSACCPAREIVSRARRRGHRPARLAWEQTGLPLLAQQIGAKVLHSPFYTCPLRAGCPVTVTVHDATFFTEPEHYDKSRRTFFRSAIKTSLRRADAGHRAEQGDPRRADPAARRRPDPHRRGLPRGRPGGVPRAQRRRRRPGYGRGSGWATRTYVAFLGANEPRKNVPNLIRGWVAAVADRPRPARAGHRRRTGPRRRDRPRRRARCRRTCGCCAPATCASATCPASSAARWSRPTPPTARASACRCSRRWPAGPRCSPRPGSRCPRSAATRSPTPDRSPDEIARDLAALLDDEPRRLALAAAGLARAKEFTWDVQRRCPPRRLGPGGRG